MSTDYMVNVPLELNDCVFNLNNENLYFASFSRNASHYLHLMLFDNCVLFCVCFVYFVYVYAKCRFQIDRFVFLLNDFGYGFEFCYTNNKNAKPMTMMEVMVAVDTAALVTIHFASVKTA